MNNLEYRMGKSRQGWLEKQLSVGFLAPSDRGRIIQKNLLTLGLS